MRSIARLIPRRGRVSSHAVKIANAIRKRHADRMIHDRVADRQPEQRVLGEHEHVVLEADPDRCLEQARSCVNEKYRLESIGYRMQTARTR